MAGAVVAPEYLNRRRFLVALASGVGGLALPGLLAGCGAGSSAVAESPRDTMPLADNFGPFDPISATTI